MTKEKAVHGTGTTAAKKGLIIAMQIWSKTPTWVAVVSFVTILYALLRWRLGYAVYCKSPRRLHGKIVIVTGASSGIGKAVATDLARRGAKVVLACRDRYGGDEAAREIRREVKAADVKFMPLNLSNFRSIRNFVEEFQRSESRLDILVNNAGVMCPRTFTEDSLDMVFGVNYVGPFYLTKLLTPLLKRSSPSRVVNVASGGYSSGRLNLEDLNGDRKKASSYDMWQTYCDSKLAVLLWTREMAKRNVPNIRCFAAHPGTVRTNIMRHWTGMSGLFLNTVSSLFFRSPEGGAQTIIDCAVRHDVDQHSGRYFEDCEMTEVTDAAADAQFAMRLWAKTESLVNSRLAGTRGGAGS